MPSIDVKKRGQSGKTENLRYIHAHLDAEHRGRLVSLPTKADPSLVIDILPVRFGKIIGFQTTYHLCAGPGQASAMSTRKLLLRDTDGVVFVADCRPARMEANIDSLQELQENLDDYGLDLVSVPHVIQYNRCDAAERVGTEELRAQLNLHGVPDFEASALTGQGVLETLRAAVRSVREDLQRRL